MEARIAQAENVGAPSRRPDSHQQAELGIDSLARLVEEHGNGVNHRNRMGEYLQGLPAGGQAEASVYPYSTADRQGVARDVDDFLKTACVQLNYERNLYSSNIKQSKVFQKR